MAYVWKPKSFSPAFKLSYGTSEAGGRLLKSVTLRNCSELAITDANVRTALNNIFAAFKSTDAFAYSLYTIEGNAKFQIEEE